MSLASISSLVYSLWARPGTYPRVEHLKGDSLWSAQALPTNIRLGWKCLPRTNTSSLQTFLNYTCKKSHNIGTSGLNYKPITIINYDSSVVNKFGASLTDEARVFIYNRHMFIVQTTSVCLFDVNGCHDFKTS